MSYRAGIQKCKNQQNISKVLCEKFWKKKWKFLANLRWTITLKDLQHICSVWYNRFVRFCRTEQITCKSFTWLLAAATCIRVTLFSSAMMSACGFFLKYSTIWLRLPFSHDLNSPLIEWFIFQLQRTCRLSFKSSTRCWVLNRMAKNESVSE